MAVITYEEVTPSIITNTTMRKLLRDGVHQVYCIDPVDGYVLHDKDGDWQDPDMMKNVASFWVGTCSCGASYDFTTVQASYVDSNGNTVLVTAYGAEREFYAVPADSVPADQIFGGVSNDHEVM